MEFRSPVGGPRWLSPAVERNQTGNRDGQDVPSTIAVHIFHENKSQSTPVGLDTVSCARTHRWVSNGKGYRNRGPTTVSMWPWGHFVFGYLAYSGFARLSSMRPFDGYTVLFVALGTQLPDIVDKPLAWTFHVLPSGRSLAHSLFAAVFLSILLGGYCRRRGRPELGIAFAIGYLSHLLGDGISYLFSGEYAYLSYLGWPLLPPPPYGDEGGFLIHLRDIEPTPLFALELAVVATLFLAVWVGDGAPGKREITEFLRKHVVDR